MKKLPMIVFTALLAWVSASVLACMVWAAVKAMARTDVPEIGAIMAAGLFTIAAVAAAIALVVLFVVNYQIVFGPLPPSVSPVVKVEGPQPDIAAAVQQAVKERESQKGMLV